MPFLKIWASPSLDTRAEDELVRALGEAIEAVPGRDENSLLAVIEREAGIYLRGRADRPIVYAELAVFANENGAGYAEFAATATQTICNAVGAAPGDVCFRFEDTLRWSAAGRYIDRRRFS